MGVAPEHLLGEVAPEIGRVVLLGAYRFAKGEMVTSSTGQKAQLKRPLDFLVIADHAENLGLAPAYRFAKGEEVKLPTGVPKKIASPLDFAAVTDHAEALGEFEICTNPDMAGYDSETCQGVRKNDIKPFQDIFAGIAQTPARRLVDICGEDGQACVDAVPAPWSRVQQAAAENYMPGGSLRSWPMSSRPTHPRDRAA